LKIKEIILLPAILDKLIWKHNINEHEVREVIKNVPKFYFIEKGDVRGEDLYSAIGRTEAGRYLTVFFVYKKTKDALIISARDMDDNERKRYGKK
jgi:uncharacterized DUF497 family protein